MTPAGQLLVELCWLGVTIEAHGDRLRYAPADRVTPELVERIRACKPAILQTLSRRLFPMTDAPKQPPTRPELIERLRAHKPELLVMLRPAPDGTDYLADEVNLEPCPSCGSLELWETASHPPRWRCQQCDPPTTALRILSLARRCRAQRATLAPDEGRAAPSTDGPTTTIARENASSATVSTNAVRQWRNHDNANRATVRNNSY